jgi:hypothetical protein
MNSSVHAEHAAFRQRFRILTAQLQALHAEWEETVPAHDLARQSALIQHEHALLTEVHALLSAFQALRTERHHQDGSGVEVKTLKKDPA